MTQPVFGFIPAAPFVAPALPVAVPAVTGAAVAGVGLAASLPVLVAVGAGLAGGFLLGAGLAQLWGRAAGPARTSPAGWWQYTTELQTLPQSKLITGTYGYLVSGSGSYCNGGPWSLSNSKYRAIDQTINAVRWKVTITVTLNDAGSCGSSPRRSGYALDLRLEWSNSYTGALNITTPFTTTWYSPQAGVNSTGAWTHVPDLSGLYVGGVPLQQATTPLEWINSSQISTELSESNNLSQPPALPLPEAFVPTPVGDPLTEQDNSTAPLPMLPPLVSPRPWPAAAPSARPVLNDGTLAPLAPALPASVPADVHYPVPGGAPVGGLAQAPQATLAGIAAEVGRIESKLNRMLNPTPVGDSSDLMQLLWQAIQALYNAMTDNRPGGAYVLSSPCELDANGDRILSSVTWPATEDNTAAVLARIDALAALLQTHKDLKQPNCKPPAATGQPVQVQFTQI